MLAQLSEQLTAEFEKGFDASNLRKMRLFYQTFPIRDALRPELSWTHYRRLLRVEDESARQWYMHEAAEQKWSSRALDRQIGTLYYERLLISQNKQAITDEAKQQIAQLKQEQTKDEDYMQLTLAPNPLHDQPQTLNINKVATLIGENGSGKSSILQSVFEERLNKRERQTGSSKRSVDIRVDQRSESFRSRD